MASLNKVMIIGNLTRDPESRSFPEGGLVANFSLATSKKFKDRNDQVKEKTEYHNISVWGRTAENCMKYLNKGKSCFVEGELETNQYTDKNGATQYRTQIKASMVQFLSPTTGSTQHKTSAQNRHQQNEQVSPQYPSDIPF